MPELVRVEAAGQLARGVLGALEGVQGASEQFGRGGVGADEARGGGDEPAGDDEAAQGDVVAAESLGPDAIVGRPKIRSPYRPGSRPRCRAQ
ncbi:hypothetical protein AQI94_33125 [Streptomyces pseudovenezuelae]|uniref:Uncharacterized protein n=1 Tax=Streptomyces pseudovenezuelae TaxID=67350 RepID=A0A117PP81_9ACTN|nr:hypothetical protein AQI94_33125 [Streptomyces pseudovenezuelae]